MTFWQKTFGGLPQGQYLRHFLFGLICYAFTVFMLGYVPYHNLGKTEMLIGSIAGGLVCLLLYPYSRFVYESVRDYFFGGTTTVYFGSTAFAARYRMATDIFLGMLLCYWFAFLIAPFGLIRLYFRNRKTV